MTRLDVLWKEKFGVSAVKGDHDFLALSQDGLIEVPGDGSLALLHLFIESALQLNMFSFLLDLQKLLQIITRSFR